MCALSIPCASPGLAHAAPPNISPLPVYPELRGVHPSPNPRASAKSAASASFDTLFCLLLSAFCIASTPLSPHVGSLCFQQLTTVAIFKLLVFKCLQQWGGVWGTHFPFSLFHFPVPCRPSISNPLRNKTWQDAS